MTCEPRRCNGSRCTRPLITHSYKFTQALKMGRHRNFTKSILTWSKRVASQQEWKKISIFSSYSQPEIIGQNEKRETSQRKVHMLGLNTRLDARRHQQPLWLRRQWSPPTRLLWQSVQQEIAAPQSKWARSAVTDNLILKFDLDSELWAFQGAQQTSSLLSRRKMHCS